MQKRPAQPLGFPIAVLSEDLGYPYTRAGTLDLTYLRRRPQRPRSPAEPDARSR